MNGLTFHPFNAWIPPRPGWGFSLGRNTVSALGIAAADIQNIHPQYNPVRYRFLVRDTQHDPSRALNAIQDLHARGVKIIIGPQTSSEVAMIKPFADAHNILVISQGSTASSLAIPGDNILWFCPNDRTEAEALVAVATARWHSGHCSALAERCWQQQYARLSAYDALFVVNLALQRPKPLKISTDSKRNSSRKQSIIEA